MMSALLPILGIAALMACSSADAVAISTGTGPDTSGISTPSSGSQTPPKDSTKDSTSTPKDTTKTPPKDTTKTPPKDTTTTPPKDTSTSPPVTSGPPTNECSALQPGWIFCDDFETDRTAQYFEYASASGHFVRSTGTGVNGSTSMRAHFDVGTVDAGSLKLAFGKTPSSYIRPIDNGTTKYREIYWRAYLRNDSTWQGGGGDKWTRAQSLVTSNWAQAMVAPVWSGGQSNNNNYLLLDPATGIGSDSVVVTTTYNDFTNLVWLGSRQGTTPIFDASHVGKWHCIEAHVKLNDAGQQNGIFEYWIDGQSQASRSDIDWVGKYSDYGINAIFFENYWNAGSPKAQNRDFDNIVVSTSRIGCGTSGS